MRPTGPGGGRRDTDTDTDADADRDEGTATIVTQTWVTVAETIEAVQQHFSHPSRVTVIPRTVDVRERETMDVTTTKASTTSNTQQHTLKAPITSTASLC